MTKGLYIIPLILASLVWDSISPAEASAYEEQQRLIDDAREGSAVKKQEGSFVIAPVPISDPTVGTGLMGVLLYLHPQHSGDKESAGATSGLALMYTDTESWLAGIFHSNAWDDDRYRFTSMMGYGDFNLEYFGTGDNPIFSNHPVGYNIAGTLFAADFSMRIPATENWFVGLNYPYFNSDVTFKLSDLAPILPDIGNRITTAGLGPTITYDSRDNNFYPTQGNYLSILWTNYGKSFGGDYEYHRLRSSFNNYQPLGEKTVLALRAQYLDSSGDVPFFDLPFLDIRGAPKTRYLDNTTLSVHTEVRHKFHPRWGMIAFVDAGWYGEDFDALSSSPIVTSVGTGLRWQAVANQPLNLGLDIAFPEDGYQIYIQIGEKF